MKNRMRILMILPYDKTYRYHGGFSKMISYAPLTLSVLAALAPKELEAEIVINDEGVEKPITQGFFDIVAITCVTSAANRAYQLCNYWRKRGSYIVMGGVHPTLMTAEALHYADSVFVGLAEETFPRFLVDFSRKVPQPVYRHQGDDGHLPMPIPRRELISGKYMNIPTIIANRGCQNNCSFCSMPQLWGRRGLTRPIAEVISEIKALGSKRIILLDPSPTADEGYAMEFFKALIPLGVKWSGLSTIDVVKKDRLFSLMVQSGCEGILAGFESIAAANLASIRKYTNIVTQYQAAVRQFHEADIPVLGCFVAGFDCDTKESLQETVELIDTIGIDLPRFSILTPFPGTPLFADFEKNGRILTQDWDLYDTMHVVFQPQKMTPAELQQTFYQMWHQAYATKRIITRINNTRREKLIKLGANIGFKYYASKLGKTGI